MYIRKLVVIQRKVGGPAEPDSNVFAAPEASTSLHSAQKWPLFPTSKLQASSCLRLFFPLVEVSTSEELSVELTEKLEAQGPGKNSAFQ